MGGDEYEALSGVAEASGAARRQLEPYGEAWRRERRQRAKSFLLVALGVIPVTGGVVAYQTAVAPSVALLAAGLLALLYVPGLSSVDCPRCGRPFHRWRASGPARWDRRSCDGCGLPYGARRDPDANRRKDG